MQSSRLPRCIRPADACDPPESAEDPFTGAIVPLVAGSPALATYDPSDCSLGQLFNATCKIWCNERFMPAYSELQCVLVEREPRVAALAAGVLVIDSDKAGGAQDGSSNRPQLVGFLPDCVMPPTVPCASLILDEEQDPFSAYDVSECIALDPGAKCIVSTVHSEHCKVTFLAICVH